MSTPRDAADQLVRLTRLMIRLDDHPVLSRTPRGPSRVLRYNHALLSAREQQVFRLLVQGKCNEHLARTLDISEEAVENHLRALLAGFHVTYRSPRRRRTRKRQSPGRRRITFLIAPVSGTVAISGATVALTVYASEPATAPAIRDAVHGRSTAARWPGRSGTSRAHPGAGALTALAHPSGTRRPEKALPLGVATATSFWDRATARGAPMRYETIASPYWPLGTKVRITYRDRSTTGVVNDFGPADWAIAQHDLPAIIDISEEMMADFTGERVDAVRVRFEVLKWGTGDRYRASGPGYELAMETTPRTPPG